MSDAEKHALTLDELAEFSRFPSLTRFETNDVVKALSAIIARVYEAERDRDGWRIEYERASRMMSVMTEECALVKAERDAARAALLADMDYKVPLCGDCDAPLIQHCLPCNGYAGDTS